MTMVGSLVEHCGVRTCYKAGCYGGGILVTMVAMEMGRRSTYDQGCFGDSTYDHVCYADRVLTTMVAMQTEYLRPWLL